jgi:hypothetical protein
MAYLVLTAPTSEFYFDEYKNLRKQNEKDPDGSLRHSPALSIGPILYVLSSFQKNEKCPNPFRKR